MRRIINDVHEDVPSEGPGPPAREPPTSHRLETLLLPSAMSYQRSDSSMSTSTPSPVRYMFPRRIWAPLCLLSAADSSQSTALPMSLSTPAPAL